jgi:hypothetical protein
VIYQVKTKEKKKKCRGTDKRGVQLIKRADIKERPEG